MSTTYSLCCFETEEALWVGQSNYLYGDDGTVDALQRFLGEHVGKPLVFVSDHDDRVIDCSNFEGKLSHQK